MLEWSRVLSSRGINSCFIGLLAILVASLCSNLGLAQKSKSARSNWVSPKSLLDQIEALESVPATKRWASTTRQLISVLIDTSQNPAQREVTLTQLVRQKDELMELARKVYRQRNRSPEMEATASNLVRMHYRLARRIDVWSALLEMPIRQTLKDMPNPKIGYRRLAFDSLPAGWVDYLLLRDFRSTFEGVNEDADQQREVARKILSRIYSPALTQDQREYIQSIFDQEVIRFLKSHASENYQPIDLLKYLEYYEFDNCERWSHHLNDFYQHALWSSEPEQQRLANILDTHYRNANFRMTISQRFMNRLLPELPTITEPVSESLNGALLSGQSQVTNNRIRVNLVPDPSQLNFHIQTQGEVLADTMARTKSIRIFSHSNAWYHVTKPVTLGKNGIDASQQAYSVGRAQQFLVDIQSNVDNMPLLGNMVRKIAANRVRDETPSTNQVFRRRVVQEAENRVEEILSKQIAKVEKSAQTQLLQPLLDFDLEPEAIQLATTEEKVIMRYRLAGRDQMAANTSRPEDEPGSLLNFQIHQSLINNALARIGLNGNTFNSEQLAAHLQDVLGTKPPEERSPASSKGKDAEFTFAKHDAVHIGFADDRLYVTLKFAKLTLKKNARPIRNVSMRAAYQVVPEGMKLKLIQDDDGTLVRPVKLRLGDRSAALTVMKVLFKQEYAVNALPEKFRKQAQAQQLKISRLVLSDSWIGVSLRDSDQSASPTANRFPMRMGTFRRPGVLLR